MNSWQQVGPTWQRLYPCGTFGIVRGDGYGVANTINSNGVLALDPGIGPQHIGYDELKAALDEKFWPKPEFCDRTELATYYRHGDLAAFAMDNGNGSWFAHYGGRFSDGTKGREHAEAQARKDVLGQS